MKAKATRSGLSSCSVPDPRSDSKSVLLRSNKSANKFCAWGDDYKPIEIQHMDRVEMTLTFAVQQNIL